MNVRGRRPADALVALGKRVRELRLVRQLTQDELAERAGVSTQTVRRLEIARPTRLETAFRIAYALHADLAFDKLFEPPPYKSLDEAIALDKATSSTRERARRRAANGGT